MRTSIFKALFTIFFLTFSVTSLAKTDPVSIDLSYQGDGHLTPGGSVTIEGVIKSAKVNQSFWDWLFSFFDNLHSQGLEVVATFPDESHDVTSQIQYLNSGKKEIKFSFSADNLNPEDLNKFTVRVFNNKRDKKRLNRLLSIQTKLEHRIEMLKALKERHRHSLALKVVIHLIDAYKSNLQLVIDRIRERIASDESLVADYILPLQVGNGQASLRRSGSLNKDFKLELIAEPGTLMSGMPARIKAVVTRVDGPDHKTYLPEIKFNDSNALEIQPTALTSEPSSYEFVTGPLSPDQNNTIELNLYEWNSHSNKATKLQASLSMDLLVISDGVSPIWAEESTPSGSNKYLQTAEPISLSVNDAFGRINTESLQVSLLGELANGESIAKEIKDLTKSNLGHGEAYLFSGDINPLEEGTYTLQAEVKDSAGNFATPNPWTAQFRIDRTAPEISFGIAENSIFDDSLIELPVKVTDFSPANTVVYQNGVEIATSDEASFSIQATLIDGKNSFEAVSTDAAGNVSQAQKLNSVIFDGVPPQLLSVSPASGEKFYTNAFPYAIPINATSDKKLALATVNGESLTVVDKNIFGTFLAQNEGDLELKFAIQRGLHTTPALISVPIQIVLDDVAPVVSSPLDKVLTERQTYDIPVNVTDNHETKTEVWVNGSKTFTTGAKDFLVNITLSKEGENEVKITSKDEAGNSSEEKIIKVVKDTTPPVIEIASPTNNSSWGSAIIPIQGVAGEPLASITANGMNLTLNGDKTTFSGNYLAPGQGPHTLTFVASDVVGNSSTTMVEIQVSAPLLVPELISASPFEDEIQIVGVQGAARPGLEITAEEGIFGLNSDVSTVRADGSFLLVLSPFAVANLHIEDPQTNEEASMTLSFSSNSRLSGVVQDIDGNPLPGATIKIQGTDYETTTNGVGGFLFDNIVSGDQTLVIDGTTIPQSTTGLTRKFSKLKIGINIGLGQANVLPRPIYLTPLLMDGSEVLVAENQSAIIQSSHAPGVTLEVPAGSATFPTGLKSGAINIMTIDAERATIPVPKAAVPSQVLSLEPSGLIFSEPVPVTMPNYYELPSKTDLAILSLNSSTGSWEVDGMAMVSEDGATIRTKEGQGITHFSTIYAVPLSPVLTPIVDNKTDAYNPTLHSLTESIEMPSFKYGDKNITPALTYKSAWARPTAYVSNLIDIPKQEITVQLADEAQTSRYQQVTFRFCRRFLFWDRCYTKYADVYTDSFYKGSSETTSWYTPKSIKSQFFVSSLKAEQSFEDPYKFSKDEISNDELFSEGGYVGFIQDKITNVKTDNLDELLPQQSIVSYAVDLQNEDGEYLPSGLYPTLARYQIALRNLTLTTVHTSLVVDQHYRRDFNEDYHNVYRHELSTLESHVLGQILPQDIAANITIQNKVHSPYGRGWHLNGVQKILNPTSSNIVIEEADGSTSGYQINNTIVTAYNPLAEEIKLDQAVDLSQWPIITATRINSNQEGDLVRIDTLGDGNPISISPLIRDAGVIGNSEDYKCPLTNYQGQFDSTTHSYKIVPEVRDLIRLPDGTLIGTDTREHSVFKVDSSYQKIVGAIRPVSDLTANLSLSDASLAQFCKNTFGATCGKKEIYAANLQCSLFICPPGVFCKPRMVPRYNNGNAPQSGYFGDGVNGALLNPNYVGLNSPMGIAIDLNGNILIADTGNNRVRMANLESATISTVMGNGANGSFPAEGGSATNVPVYHPRGLLTDSDGNLFVTTENGYILRKDNSGNVSKIAGLPLEMGGIFANQGLASVMAFNKPFGMALDQSSHYLYVADTGNNRVVRIDLVSGQADVIAGNGTCDVNNSMDNGPATAANICAPTEISLDQDGNLIVVESGRNVIRKVIFNQSSTDSLMFASVGKDISTLVRKQDGTWLRTFRNGTKIEFNEIGLQTSAIDKLGREVSYFYDSSNNLTRIKFPSDQEITYVYSGGGKLQEIIDPAGRATQFSYNGDQLSLVVYPDGTSKSFGYNESGLLSRETNQRGFTTAFEYNEYHRFKSATLSDQSVVQADDYISQSIGSGSSNETSLKSLDEIASVFIDNNQNPSNVIYDINGLATIFENSLGNKTVVNRTFDGLPVEINFANGLARRFTYDEKTYDLLKVQESDESGSYRDVLNREYNSNGQVVVEKDNKGVVKTVSYAENGLPVSVDRGDKHTSLTYDTRGFLISKTETALGKSRTTIYGRNIKGFITSITNADGTHVSFDYDAAGNMTKRVENTTSGQESITSYEYDTFNRVTSVTSPKNEVTRYSYLENGELYKIIDPKGRVALYEHDRRGNLIRKTDFDGRVSSYNYDSNRNLVREVTPGGKEINYAYDRIDRLIKTEYPDDTLTYGYNEVGQLSLAQNKNSKVLITRDVRGRILNYSLEGLGEMSSFPEVAIGYKFDNHDNVVLRTSNFGDVAYDHDEFGRTTSIIGATGNEYFFTYDTFNNLVNVFRPGSKTSISYTDAGAVSNIDHIASGVRRSFASYAYGPRNLMLQRQDSMGTYNANYDLNGQLVGVSGPDTEVFSYDSIGNRLTDARGTYQYDVVRSQLEEDYRYKYYYDLEGNLITKMPKDQAGKAYQYSYNAKNQLIEVKISTSSIGQMETNVLYFYDALGRRMEKRVQKQGALYSRKYIYENKNVVAQLDASNNILVMYDHSSLGIDDVLGMDVTSFGVQAGIANYAGKFYFLKDKVGSITDIIDGFGNVVQRYRYSAFGVIEDIIDSAGKSISSSPLIKTNYSFAGREWDTEAGLYYNRARYYDPSIGRFLQKDPNPGHKAISLTVVNPFIYAINNPLAFSDPNGEFVFTTALLIAMAVTAAVNFGVALNSGASISQAFGSAAIGALSAAIVPGVGGLFSNAIVGAFVGSAVAGAFSGAAHASLYGGDMGVGATLGAAGGLIGAGLAGGVYSKVYDIGFTQAASRILAEPWSILGASSVNSGISPKQEDEGPVGTIRTREPGG